MQEPALSREIGHGRQTESAWQGGGWPFHRLLENFPAGAYTCDPGGLITYFNQQAVRLWGRAPKLNDPVDRYCGSFKLFATDGSPIAHDQCWMALALQMHKEYNGQEIVIERPDGQRITVLAYANPIHDEFGKLVGAVNVLVDISERQQAEELRARLAAIVESSDDAVISKDLNAIITSWNRGAERLYGYTAEEVLGRPITLLVPPDHADEIVQIMQRLQRGERIEHYETVRRAKDGRLLAVSVTISPIKDAAGQVIGASSVARDITERKRAEAEREQLLAQAEKAQKEAEEANRLKDEFLATISHELRTPLTSILGWTQLLRDDRLDRAAVARALETIERNAKAQNQLIEDLLDIARIVSRKLRLTMGPVELTHIIGAAIDLMRPTAEAKGIHLESQLDPDASAIVGDADRLQQVIWNLLSNAIKFTPKGGRVQVRLQRVSSHVEIQVRDTGQGIRPDFLPYVFERFRQADSTTTGRQGGLGLGLAIVRHLVELHGGTVRADSPGEGQGAAFMVRLPLAAVRLAADDAGRVPPASERSVLVAHPPMLDGVQVLVVDDEAEARELLTVVLEQCGAQVRVAASAGQALEALERSRPDVLVSDIGMPGVDGYTLIRQVRALGPERGGRIPAVALTAYARAEDRLRALLAGYQTHVPKPIEAAELTMIVASLVGRAVHSD